MSTLQSPLVARDTCLSEDVVLAFQNGETTEAERQRIHRHIDSCDDCRRLLLATTALQEDGGALNVELDSMERLAAAMGSGLRMTTFTEGKQLAQRFNVTRFVDRGGMGEVYEAFDSVVGARVALKALLCTALDDAPGARRLGDEVKLARRVAHPNVCRIYDLHEHREPEHGSLWFLAMEFVDGVTLKEHLLSKPLSIEDACTIARQLLSGLGAVHAAGVLHLDFKSQNVMLRQGSSSAQAVVMDFSLSRAFENELRLRTSERHAAGSIGYMSPEQLECQSTLGPAADVYAFGVVFYEMLTGQMPFQGNSPAAIMLKQLKPQVSPPSQLRAGISPALDEFVATCLSRHARSRFQSVESASAALDRCLQPKPPRRTGAGLRSLAVALLATTGAGTLVHLTWRLTAAERPPAAAPTVIEHVTQPSLPRAPADEAAAGASESAGAGESAGAASPAAAGGSSSPVSDLGTPTPVARTGPGGGSSRESGAAPVPRSAAPRASSARKPATKPAPPAGLGSPKPPATPAPQPGAPVPSTPDAPARAGASEREPAASEAVQHEPEPWVPKNAPDFLLDP